MVHSGDRPAEIRAPARNADGFALQAVHLVRTALQANLTLSQMADQKASILMGATFVVFSISVGQASGGRFPVPLLILALFAGISALLAVAAILPRVRIDEQPDEALNLMFFGGFTQLSEEEFIERMLRRLESDEQMFRTMLRDLYQNGQVLKRRKYRLLRWAYIAFLVGLVLSLTSVVVLYRGQFAALL